MAVITTWQSVLARNSSLLCLHLSNVKSQLAVFAPPLRVVGGHSFLLSFGKPEAVEWGEATSRRVQMARQAHATPP